MVVGLMVPPLFNTVHLNFLLNALFCAFNVVDSAKKILHEAVYK